MSNNELYDKILEYALELQQKESISLNQQFVVTNENMRIGVHHIDYKNTDKKIPHRPRKEIFYAFKTASEELKSQQENIWPSKKWERLVTKLSDVFNSPTYNNEIKTLAHMQAGTQRIQKHLHVDKHIHQNYTDILLCTINLQDQIRENSLVINQRMYDISDTTVAYDTLAQNNKLRQAN